MKQQQLEKDKMVLEDALRTLVYALYNQPELLEEPELWSPISALLHGDEEYLKPISLSELDNKVWRHRNSSRSMERSQCNTI